MPEIYPFPKIYPHQKPNPEFVEILIDVKNFMLLYPNCRYICNIIEFHIPVRKTSMKLRDFVSAAVAINGHCTMEGFIQHAVGIDYTELNRNVVYNTRLEFVNYLIEQFS